MINRLSVLLTFLVPMVLVCALIGTINWVVLPEFAIYQKHMADKLDVMDKTARLGRDMLEIHLELSRTLTQVREGKMHNLQAYRSHAQLIDSLAGLERDVALLQSAGEAQGSQVALQTRAAAQAFADYRRFIFMATDISAIAPDKASAYAEKAYGEYVDFARHAHDATVAQAQAARAELTHLNLQSSKLWRASFNTELLGVLAMLVLGLVLFIWHTRHLSAVAAMLSDLAARSDSDHGGMDEEAVHKMMAIAASRNTLVREMAQAVLAFHRAIALRRQALQALEAEQHLQRIILEKMPDLVWLKDTQGMFRAANPRFEQLMGATEAQIIGKTDHDFVPAKLADSFRATDRKVMEAGVALSNEESLTFRSDGHTELVETIKTPVFDAQGGILGVLGVARDITAFRKMTEALRLREQMFSAIMQQSPAGIVLIRVADHGFAEFNDAACGMLGYTRAEFAALSMTHIQSEHEAVPCLLCNIADLCEAPRSWEMEQRRKDGSTLEVLVNSRRMAIDGNTFILSVWTDISASKKNERALLALQSQLQEMVAERTAELTDLYNHSPVGYQSIDPDGTITRMNDRELQWLGYAREEVIGKMHIRQLMPAGTEPFFKERQMRLQAGRKVPPTDAQLVRKDGSLLDIRVSSTAEFDKAGRPCRLHSAMMDISELKKLELEVHKQEMEIATRKQMDTMKNGFISVVSHELRTPITSIRGALGLLAGGVFGELPPRAREMLRIANENSQRLIILVNDILDIDKIASGNLTLRADRINLRELIAQSVQANEAYATGHQVSLRFPPGAPAMAVGDADRVLQILDNLLSNAAKFSRPQGVVEIRTLAAADMVRIEVQDWGHGIPEDFQSRVFEVFAQADSTNTRRQGGTGLGLNISKRLIEEMKGQIGYDTVPDQGTTFWFTIPAASSASS